MAPLTLYIIGDGGHAHDIKDDRYAWSHGRDPGLVHFVPHHSEFGLAEHRPEDHFIIGINDLKVRELVAVEIGALGLDDGRWVHHRAYLNDTRIGEGTHVNYAVNATRTTIGDYCTIAPGVTICGDVTIGDRVFVGAGATIINLVTIGDDAFIRAGSVVTRDVAAGERY